MLSDTIQKFPEGRATHRTCTLVVVAAAIIVVVIAVAAAADCNGRRPI